MAQRAAAAVVEEPVLVPVKGAKSTGKRLSVRR
jgi:hypothetical protein